MGLQEVRALHLKDFSDKALMVYYLLCISGNSGEQAKVGREEEV